MTSFNITPPLEPHQGLALKVARRWRQEHRFKAFLVELLARIRPTRGNPACHPLEQCPATPQEELEELMERWCRHWLGCLASTSQGRLQLDLRDRANDIRLDREGW